MDGRFNRERVRFHTKEKNTLVIQGWFEGDEEGAERFEARLGGRKLLLETVVQRGAEVTKKYLRYRTNVMTEYFLMIRLPGRTPQELHGQTLRVWHLCGKRGQSAVFSEKAAGGGSMPGSECPAESAGGGECGQSAVSSEKAAGGGSMPGSECPAESAGGGERGQSAIPSEKAANGGAEACISCAAAGAGRMDGAGPENPGKADRRCIFRMSAAGIGRLACRLESWMETLRELPDGRYQLCGWYIGVSHAQIAVLDIRGHVLHSRCGEGRRLDILSEFPEAVLEETHGFAVTFDRPDGNFLRLALKGEGRRALYPVDCRRMLSGREGLVNLARKSYLYFRRNGARQFVRRVSDVAFGNDSISYERWRRKYGVKKEELARQRQTRFPWEPKISIVVPLYRTPEKFLREMIASVEQQTYQNWELVLSDGSGNGALTQLLREYEAKDGRIRVLYAGGREENIAAGGPLRIAPNTNRAIAAAAGDYIAFLDHDDLLSPDALWECVRTLQAHPDAALIYSDEDKTDASGRRYFEPHFKSDYNPELLCSMNYICHFVMVSRRLPACEDGLDSAFDGAQDYDFVLRCAEQAGEGRIFHIPKILYHWRSHGESTAENPESKHYAFEAGRRAIAAHYQRLGLEAKVSMGEYQGLYHTEFAIRRKEDGSLPVISILIPNKDHRADLEKCVRSVTEQSDYSNYEILVIENNSEEPETFAAYQELERRIPALRVIYYKGEFNFSAINNFGARHAKGDYLLLLNNDTEMIGPDCLRQMLGYCQLPEVGAVGALLYYEDNTIQHAGVVLGFGGIAGHAFIGSRRGDNGYFSRIICAQDYSAVTAACMMVKASAYREAGGMTEELRVAFNDIDFCMKLRTAGYRIVYNPGAQLYHFESKSRGLENTPEKIERFNSETAQFLARWGKQVAAGDPYYSPNLTLNRADFALRV